MRRRVTGAARSATRRRSRGRAASGTRRPASGSAFELDSGSMKVGRGIAAGSIVAACLFVFAGCVFDWNLQPLATEGADAASDVSVQDAIADSAPHPPDASTSCQTNSDCEGGLCYYVGAGAQCEATSGTCILPSASCGGGATSGPAGANVEVCGCVGFQQDACAPLGGVTQCPAAANGTRCGYLTCPSGTAFCEVSAGGRRFDCRAWSAADCSSSVSQHTCECARKVCDAGGSCDSTAPGVVTCQ